MELGLNRRFKGTAYNKELKTKIISAVNDLIKSGVSKTKALRMLAVSRSTYYGWFKSKPQKDKIMPVHSLTEVEKQAVVEKKKKEPQLSHRQISGYLRDDGHWISPSSCYRILKSFGWVQQPDLRESPWKVPHYEPYLPNQIWGGDWTIISVNNSRHYLVTIIDYFSRYVIAWGITKTVTKKEIRDLLALAYMSENIESKNIKPIFRVDRGSPNMARSTRELIKELELVLSPSRSARPTDNARQERWYRTVKQEEIYCYPTYLSLDIARDSLSKYIELYNEKRPHQALWNYTPGHVHRLRSKSKLIEDYKTNVEKAVLNRKHNNRRMYYN